MKMNRTIVSTAVGAYVFLLSGITLAGEAESAAAQLHADEMYQLMKDRGYRCLECHDVDKRVVGPSWTEVAVNRHANKWAQELIVYKISAGSVGEYGTERMPHNEVRDEDADVIADWILSLADSVPQVAAKGIAPRP
ncbi:MAG: hypothetical protein PVG98_01690 [Chromatiales bacterium]|jgi:cytochrome c